MKFTFTFLLSCLLLTSCSTGKKVISESDDLVADSPPPVVTTTIQGSYKSTKGIMTKLSCYCSNGGTITTESGKEFLICFSENIEVPNCDNLTVTGNFTMKELQSEESSPCPSGQIRYLKVKDFKCAE